MPVKKPIKKKKFSRPDLKEAVINLDPKGRKTVLDILKTYLKGARISRDQIRSFADFNPKDIGKKEFCDMLEIAKNNITNWIGEGMPLNSNGRIDPAIWFRWWKETKGGTTRVINQETKKEELRKIKAIADLKEFELQKLNGELVDRDFIVQKLKLYITSVATILDDLPKRIQPIIPKSQRAEIMKQINEALEEVREEASEVKV